MAGTGLVLFVVDHLREVDRAPASSQVGKLFDLSGPPALVLSAFGILVFLFPFSPWWPQDGGTTTTTTSSVVTTSSPGSTAPTTGPTGPDTGTGIGTTLPSGCFIEVTHFATNLKEEPNMFSRTLSDVPLRTYIPIEATITEFAGRTEQWFRIEVEGRVGWVLDDPILLDKSSECP